MKKFLIINLFSMLFLYGEPYKPFPIIFIHGYTSNAGTWGAAWDKDNRTDTLLGEGERTFKVFLNKMLPYVWVQETLRIETTFAIPGGIPGYPEPDPGYPNKSFLEVINFDYAVGSVDSEKAVLFDVVEFLYLLRGGIDLCAQGCNFKGKGYFSSALSVYIAYSKFF